jgi:hypothetical protein
MMKLYYHKTSGGAEYLFDTYIKCNDGHKEGVINDKTKYVVRIDGDIRQDAELNIRDEAGELLYEALKLILEELPQEGFKPDSPIAKGWAAIAKGKP